jgi:elongation factor G
LLEKIAENDEKLMEKYFAEGALSPDEVRSGLKNALRQRNVLPVLVSDALANRGVQQLLDFLVAFAPAPVDVPPATAKNGNPVKAV